MKGVLVKRCLAAAAFLVSLSAVGQATADDQPVAPINEEMVAAGSELYAMACAACHGERLRSTGAAFDLLQLGPEERPRFDQSVLGGKGEMPAWKDKLTAGEIDAIWAYIRDKAG